MMDERVEREDLGAGAPAKAGDPQDGLAAPSASAPSLTPDYLRRYCDCPPDDCDCLYGEAADTIAALRAERAEGVWLRIDTVTDAQLSVCEDAATDAANTLPGTFDSEAYWSAYRAALKALAE